MDRTLMTNDGVTALRIKRLAARLISSRKVTALVRPALLFVLVSEIMVLLKLSLVLYLICIVVQVIVKFRNALELFDRQ